MPTMQVADDSGIPELLIGFAFSVLHNTYAKVQLQW